MPLQRRREGRPSGGQSSSGAAKPTASPPGGDEVRQINRELQRLDDVIRPLEDILENPPSSETAELVDIYLSEAQKKVEELQLHADFCVEQGHFDVFQRIADCKSNFDELSVRANSWKEAASHQEARSSPLGAAPRGAAPAASPQASASPARSEDHLPDLEPLEAPQASDPSPQAAQPSPGSFQQSMRSQASAADPTPGAAGGAQPSPGSFQQSMRSQASAADPTPGAAGGAQPSPGSFQQSMRSQASAADPTPGAAGGAYQSPGSVQQSMRSQASAADPTPGAFGGAQPSPGAAFSSMKSQASAVAPGSAQLGAAQAAPTPGSGAAPASQTMLGTGSTWPSPSGPSWSEWIWPAQPPTPEAAVTLPLDKSKSTPSSRKKLLNQEAAKWRLQDALKMSKQDPHMLSSALHDAKDNNLEQTAPELVRQAEDALQEAQMASQRSAAERELDTAVATLSADLNTKDVDTGRLSQHTQLLQRAIEDATAAGLQTSQADELLRQAEDAQNSLRRFPPTATLPEQARDAPAQPFPSPSSAFGAEAKETDAHWQAFPAPSPQRQASPVAEAKETDARWQAFPAPSPASRQTSPVTEVAPAASIQMKDKVGKLLQTLLVGGSTSEQLRKAVEVAKVAGLDPERCEHALQVAEERSLAHREAAAALSSGDGAAMRHALFHLESAGGPAADRRQILQVLEMAGKGSVPSSCQLRSAADRESFKAKEEQLLQHLKEAREQDLEDFRAAVSAWTQSRARIYAAPDPEPDARSGMATEPTTKVDEPPAFQHGWTNPFGLDPTREVFNPFPPPVEYGTLLTNAHHRAKLQGQAFEHPDFWRSSKGQTGRMAPTAMHF